jgi:hypothetical protein
MWVWGAGFLAFSLVTSVVTARGGRVNIAALCAIGAGCWGAGYAVLRAQPDAAASRLIAIGAVGSGMFLAALPFLLRGRVLQASMFLWVAVAGITVRGLASPRRSSSAPRVVTTAVHQLSVTYIPQLVDSIESDGGAIEVLDDGFLLVTGEGEFYRLSWDSAGAVLGSARLAPSAPLNRRSYLAEHQDPRTAPRLRVTDRSPNRRTFSCRVSESATSLSWVRASFRRGRAIYWWRHSAECRCCACACVATA